MTTRQAFSRPAQQFAALALSALFTVVIFSSVNELAAQPGQEAPMAQLAQKSEVAPGTPQALSAAPAAARANT